jgi:hypothetical protein
MEIKDVISTVIPNTTSALSLVFSAWLHLPLLLQTDLNFQIPFPYSVKCGGNFALLRVGQMF